MDKKMLLLFSSISVPVLFMCRDGSFAIATRLQAPRNRGSISSRGTHFLSSLLPDLLWGPPGLLSTGYRGRSGRGVKLTIHLHLVRRLRMVSLDHVTMTW
jgi:hypothetical protein